MFPIIFIVLAIVKANVHHFPAVAEVVFVIAGIFSVIELLWYVFLLVGVVLGFRKVRKGK